MNMGIPHGGRALVTGSAHGLGAAFVRQLAGQGMELVTIDREAAQQPPGRMHLVCDLADRDAVDRLVLKLGEMAPFSMVILNAGASATGRFETLPPESGEVLIRLNAETPMVLAAALAGKGMMAKPSAMLFISSLSRFTGYPGATAYAASKDALAVYARSIRKPFGRLGISVSCAYPGPLRTAHAERHAPPGADAAARMEPEEAASRILRSVAAGHHSILPGGNARLAAIAGTLLPGAATRFMRRVIYEKLDRDVF